MLLKDIRHYFTTDTRGPLTLQEIKDLKEADSQGWEDIRDGLDDGTFTYPTRERSC